MTMASGVGRVVRRGESEADGIMAYDLLFESIRQFQSDFAPMISTEGLFIETDEPLETSTVLRFRVVLPDDFVLIEGTGVVVWIRTAEDTGPPPLGMAIRFASLNERSRELIEKVVDAHVRDGGRAFDVDGAGSSPPEPLPVAPPPPPARPPQDKAAAAEREAIRFSVRGASPPSKAEAPPKPAGPPITEPARKLAPKPAVQAAARPAQTPAEKPRRAPVAPPQGKPESRPTAEASVAGAPAARLEEPAAPAPRPEASFEVPVSSPIPPADEPGSAMQSDLDTGPAGGHVGFAADSDEVTASELDFGAESTTPEERAAGHDFYAQLAAREADDQGSFDDDAEELSLDDAMPMEEASDVWMPPEVDANGSGDTEPQGTAAPPAAFDDEGVDELSFGATDEAEELWQDSSSVPDAGREAAVEPAPDLEAEGRQVAASFELPDERSGPDPELDWGTVMAAAETAEKASPAPARWALGTDRERAADSTVEAFDSGEFNVSVFDKDDGPDATPRMGGVGEAAEITMGEVRKRRFPVTAVAIIAVVVALVAAGAVFGPGLLERFVGPDGGEVDVVQVSDPDSDQPAVVEPAAGEPGSAATAGAETVADSTTAIPEPTPAPTAVPERHVAPGPAHEVLDIGFEVGASGTTIIIVGDAAIHEGLVATFPMSDPPRVLVRLRGISAGYPRETVAVDSNEVAQIRVGHHPEQTPPALYVVLDLVDEQVAVLGSDIKGDVLRVSVGR